MRPIHVKIYCKVCGRLLLHQRLEIPEPDITPDEVANPLRAYVGLEVEPCPDCLNGLFEKEKTSTACLSSLDIFCGEAVEDEINRREIEIVEWGRDTIG